MKISNLKSQISGLLCLLCLLAATPLFAPPPAPRVRDIRIQQFDGLNWKDVVLHPTNTMVITFDENRIPIIGVGLTSADLPMTNDTVTVHPSNTNGLSLWDAGSASFAPVLQDKGDFNTYLGGGPDSRAGSLIVNYAGGMRFLFTLDCVAAALFRDQVQCLKPVYFNNTYATNSAGPTIHFGATNTPTFSTANGSLYLSALGGFYVRTNSAWFAVKLN